jgi:DNA-binding IclR family transcriptional regulator
MQSVNRALDVLFLLAQSGGTRPASVVARELDLPRPTVYRILETLGSKGVVAKVGDEFGVTEKLGRIAAGTAGVGLADVVHRYLQTLVGITDETSGLHVRYGDIRRCIAEVEGHHGIRWARGVGFTAPVWSGAVGHVILADLADDEIVQIASRADFTPLAPMTVSGADELLDRVAAARDRGWSMSSGETVEGAAAVAAPLENATGRTIAVMSLYAPADRFAAIQEYVPALLDTAAMASQEWVGLTSTAGVGGHKGDSFH